jgi:DNA adenine methylase
MNEQASAWLTAVEGLPLVHERLKRVVVLQDDALRVIRREDGPDTCFYLDPPYLPTTRAAADVYRHEMSVEDHIGMLDLILSVEGKVLLSGYANERYDERLAGWKVHRFDLPNNAAGGATKRRMVECVWCNFYGPGQKICNADLPKWCPRATTPECRKPNIPPTIFESEPFRRSTPAWR